MPRSPKPAPPLGRTLAAAAILTALLVAASAAGLLFGVTGVRDDDVLHLAALIIADVFAFAIFSVIAAHQLRKRVTKPLADVVEAAEAIAAGDLSRRMPAGATREFAALAESINRMTERLVDAQAYRLRVEKVATLGHLAAGVADEMGTPLGDIHGYAHLLRWQLAGDAVAVQAVEGIERESERLDRVVRGLLDYARPRNHATPAPVDVNDTVRYALRALGDEARMRQVRIGLTLDPGHPAVFGERRELEQLFTNLVLNALDAVNGTGDIAIHTRRVSRAALREAAVRRADDPPATVVPRAPSRRVTEWLANALPPAEAIKIVISDSGPGFPEEEAERVFEPYHGTAGEETDATSRLVMVGRAVESFGGTIWVERAREGGAAFHLLLPSAMSSAVRDPRGPRPTLPRATLPRTTGVGA